MTRAAFRALVRGGADDSRIELASLRDAGAGPDFRPDRLLGVVALRTPRET
jgi:hypothetical protein